MNPNHKNFLIFCGLIALGFAGKNAITPDEPTLFFPGDDETIVADTLTGKKELKEQFEKEKKAIEQTLNLVKNERDTLLQEKISRGELERQQTLKQQNIINAIDKHLGGVFKGQAEFIYTTSKAYNVNPLLVSAIAKFETKNGISDVVKNANNPGGLNYYKGCKFQKYGWYQKFPTLKIGIEEMIRVLKEVYIDNGHGDITSIGNKYAPLDDSRNGIEGMDNNKWSKFVTKYYIEMLNTSEVSK